MAEKRLNNEELKILLEQETEKRKRIEAEHKKAIDEWEIRLRYSRRGLEVTNRELAKANNKLAVLNEELNKAQSELENRVLERTAELETEKNKTLAIINNLTDGLLVFNNNKIVLCNPMAKTMLDLKGNLSNTSLENLKSDKLKKLLTNYLKNKKAVLRFQFEMNENQMLEFSSIPIVISESEKNNSLNVAIFHDITREKMIDQMKSEFITVAAHQLRTPLSAVKWCIKMVLDGDLGEMNDQQRKMLSKGYLSNERMIILVNDLLNVSQIEEGRYGYDYKKHDFNKIWEEVLVNFSDKHKNKTNLKIHIPKKLPKVKVDKEKIIMVMQNLLDNAVRYTPENGQIDVTIEAGDKFFIIKIKDNGVGIPLKDQSKLFSKFFRAQNVVLMQTEGSGLGLFIVKNIINKHNGDVSFFSEEGKGTEFIITLPINGPNSEVK